MKLLYFTIQINMLGGLAKIVIDKINWLVDHGYDVTLCNIERLEVVPFGDTDRYAERLRLLMEIPAERERLADNALISVKKFDKDYVMQQWVILFENLSMREKNCKNLTY